MGRINRTSLSGSERAVVWLERVGSLLGRGGVARGIDAVGGPGTGRRGADFAGFWGWCGGCV